MVSRNAEGKGRASVLCWKSRTNLGSIGSVSLETALARLSRALTGVSSNRRPRTGQGCCARQRAARRDYQGPIVSGRRSAVWHQPTSDRRFGQAGLRSERATSYSERKRLHSLAIFNARGGPHLVPSWTVLTRYELPSEFTRFFLSHCTISALSNNGFPSTRRHGTCDCPANAARLVSAP